jgi:hypothetical protein
MEQKSNLKPEAHEPTESEISGSESLEHQGVQEPHLGESTKGRTLAFLQVNEVTLKLTDGRGSNAWSGDRSAGFRVPGQSHG